MLVNSLFSFLLIFEIAHEDAAASNADFAPGSAFPICFVSAQVVHFGNVDDFKLDGFDRPSYMSADSVLRADQERDCGRLGLAVPLDQCDTAHYLDELDDLSGQRGRARHHNSHLAPESHLLGLVENQLVVDRVGTLPGCPEVVQLGSDRLLE